MSGPYLAPAPLSPGHNIGDFASTSGEQTEWLHRHARASHGGGLTKVFVVTERGRADVVGYYAWSMASLRFDDAPARVVAGGGRHPVPVALLARLAVDSRHERRGLGAGMLQDVLLRAAGISEKIGCRGLLIHCETDAAREFYRKHVPAFEPSPSDPMHLVLLMKDLRRAIAG